MDRRRMLISTLAASTAFLKVLHGNAKWLLSQGLGISISEFEKLWGEGVHYKISGVSVTNEKFDNGGVMVYDNGLGLIDNITMDSPGDWTDREALDLSALFLPYDYTQVDGVDDGDRAYFNCNSEWLAWKFGNSYWESEATGIPGDFVIDFAYTGDRFRGATQVYRIRWSIGRYDYEKSE